MSEAEKVKVNGDAAGSGERASNVKPFPDFIVPPPAASSPPPSSAPTAEPPPTVVVSGASPKSPPRARSGGGWALMFALVSLTAAGVSLSAPSLRPIAAEKLKQQFGDHYWIGVLTGTADTRPPSVIELDLKQFDTRLQALANTLTTANPGAPMDAATLARFADAAGATQRMKELETALDQLKSGEAEHVGALSRAVSRMEVALNEGNLRAETAENVARTLSEQLKTTETQAARAAELAEQADTGAKEVATSLGGMLRKLETVEAGLGDLTSKLGAMGAQVGQQIAAALGPINARLDGMDKKAADVAAQAAAAFQSVRTEIASVAGNFAGMAEELKAMQALEEAQDARIGGLADELKGFKADVSQIGAGVGAVAGRLQTVEQTVARQQGAAGGLLLGLSNRLRVAVDEGEPFLAELAALRALSEGDPAFAAPLSVLAPLAERGAPSLSLLRREFNVLARKIVEAEDAAQPAWHQRQWSNIQYYVGWGRPPQTAIASSEASRALLAQAAGAINAGNFSEALGAMSSLQGQGADAAGPWLGAARARIAAEQAVRVLNATALNRVGR